MRNLINYIKEGMVTIWSMTEDYILYVVCLDFFASFGCLAKFAALFSARVFSCGDSLIFLRDIV